MTRMKRTKLNPWLEKKKKKKLQCQHFKVARCHVRWWHIYCRMIRLPDFSSVNICRRENRSALSGMGCQTARDLARLSLDQSCCSHVRGIMLLSIPPYPAAQPAVTPGEQDPHSHCLAAAGGGGRSPHRYLSPTAGEGKGCCLLLRVILTDEAWGCRPAHHGIGTPPGREAGLSSIIPRRGKSVLWVCSVHIYYSSFF